MEHDEIVERYGEVRGYLTDRPVVTDDDISGTLVFLRAISPREIGYTWLNSIVRNRSTIWWGGRDLSTEHAAYENLANGVDAPESGSIARNGAWLAEQIGGQIFIDGWAMVCPGDPGRAADLAERAARVSHDGEAIVAARAIAAIESAAFIEHDVDRLLDSALACIAGDSVIAHVIDDVRSWRVVDDDWRTTRWRIAERYGPQRYGGSVHVVPNHALVILGLTYAADDFSRAMRVVATAGWDTDCNAGTLGCILGIRGGVSVFECEYDWRGPIADRILISSVHGGRAVTDAVREARTIAEIARGTANSEPRYSFAFPGSVQGWTAADAVTTIENRDGRGLRVSVTGSGRVSTPTWVSPVAEAMAEYELLSSPTLYPGQTVRARLRADDPVTVALFIRLARSTETDGTIESERRPIAAGKDTEIVWSVPDSDRYPVFSVGLSIETEAGRRTSVTVRSLDWYGYPDCALPAMPRDAWVDALERWDARHDGQFVLTETHGRGLLMHGADDWRDYRVSATMTGATGRDGFATGLAVRVQGLRRYYAALFGDVGIVRIVRVVHEERVIAAVPFPVEAGRAYRVCMSMVGTEISLSIDGSRLVSVDDPDSPLIGGGIALVVENGSASWSAVTVRPPTDGTGELGTR
jgi:ADP-ribosylglycohydrolase